VILEGEAGDGVVGLGLQEGGLDPARARGLQPRHAAPVERLATSDVMKTVLPDRARPVTPRRMTGSKKVSEMPEAIPSTPRPSVSAIVPITKVGMSFCLPGVH
jgi:hypothetical protein